ncbi:MAG TPA: serine/threonine-protein kinase [Kofleriaceae bacterium]|nr:serine/threonine-protein kinase [Kofleriaceae bacterium]
MGEDTASDDSLGPLLAAVARLPVRRWTPPGELDEYRLVRPLGSGDMGSVWLAMDRLLDRMVAIKFIAYAEPDASTRERFAIEARAAARLAHVNVVTVYRFGEIAGRPYLVSEYIRGESLEKIEKPLPWQRCLELGIALARGLAAAHRAGIVHRDIKPANAILGADGVVKLVDFGLAKLRGERGSRRRVRADAARDDRRHTALPGAGGARGRGRGPPQRRLPDRCSALRARDGARRSPTHRTARTSRSRSRPRRRGSRRWSSAACTAIRPCGTRQATSSARRSSGTRPGKDAWRATRG